MEPTKQTSQQYFRILSILHLALTLGLVFAGVIGTVLILSGAMSANGTELTGILSYAIPMVSVVGLFLSHLVYKNKLSELKEMIDLNIKMTSYRGVLILRFAIIETPAFFAFVAALLTGNLLFLVYVAMMILFMIYWRPTINSVSADLGLNPNHSAIIRNPDSIIAEFTNPNKD